MTPASRFTDKDIDGLVRCALREDARAADVEKNYAAIQDRLKHDAASTDGARPGLLLFDRVLGVPFRRLGIAAGIMLAIGLGWWMLSPSAISAHSLVVAAHQHAVKADRHYLVQIDVPQAWRSLNFLTRSDWETDVWTRGNRFRAVMRAPDRSLTWGQDGKRNVWLVSNESQALLYSRNEVPPILFAARAMLCLDVGQLTKRFADEYDLVYQQPDANADPSQAVILATAKPGSTKSVTNVVTRGRLVIDRQTHVVQEMQLYRKLSAQRELSITFSLVERANQPDELYELQGNLPPDADVLDRQRSDEREDAFRRLREMGMPPERRGAAATRP